jgi:glycosyltransferase involved in cell wall biosynthesis
VSARLASILINNFNYGRFLGDAIESALAQTYAPVEVVVVDDGSTDESRSVISSFGSRVIPVFKANGGQASAFNTGVAHGRGDVLCFLDADDIFDREKVAHVMQAFEERDVSNAPLLVYHPLSVIDAKGIILAPRAFEPIYSSPINLYEFAQRYRYVDHAVGPTTGISINRVLAEKLFPLPEHRIAIAADTFLVTAASLIADIYALDVTLAQYRIHGENRWYTSRRRPDANYLQTLDRYLNAILRREGKDEVIDFTRGMYAWHDWAQERRWRELSIGIVRALLLHADFHTLRFALTAVLHAWPRTGAISVSVGRLLRALGLLRDRPRSPKVMARQGQ